MFSGVTWLEMKIESTSTVAEPPAEQVVWMFKKPWVAGAEVETKTSL
jgi:hypothetical protein